MKRIFAFGFFLMSVLACFGQIVINEYCPFPSVSGAGVDANGDGHVNGNTDEFVELVNAGITPIDITGWKIHGGSSLTLRYTFGSLVLKPGQTVVVFGAWNLSTGGPAPTEIGGSRVFFSVVDIAPSASLGMANGGSTLELRDASDAVQASVTYVSSTNSISFVRDPDVTGGSFIDHPDLGGRTISPGTKSDGTLFNTKIGFAPAEANASEASGTYNLTVSIANPNPAPTTADLVLVSGTASRIGSYTTQSINFPGGSSADITIPVTITDNASSDGDEVFIFELQNIADHADTITSSAEGRFRLTVQDDDVTKIGFSPASISVGEGDGEYQLSVSIQNPSLTDATTAEIVLVNGDADEIGNYVTVPVTFPAGSSTDQIIDITITDDSEIEGSELFVFQVQGVVGGIADPSADKFELTIQDDDNTIVINELHPRLATSPNGDTNGDGLRNTTNDEFIELVNYGNSPVDISGWSLTTGAAVPGTIQHKFPTGTIIPAGGVILVFGGPIENGLTEFPNTFGGSLIQSADDNGDDPGGSIGLSFTDGGTTVRLYVKGSPTSVDTLIEAVTYASAGAGVSVVRDPDITGTFTTSHPELGGKFLSPGLKIDGTPFFSNVRFSSSETSVNEDAGTVNIEISIFTPDGALETDFDVLLISGDAADLNNFTTQHHSQTGSGPLNFSVTVTDDMLIEGDEVFEFQIQNVTGPVAVKPSSFFLRVSDNDFTKLKFSPTTASVGEGAGTYNLEISIENPDETNSTSCDVVMVSGDPSDVDGFTTVPLTFAAGSSESQLATINITNDQETEGNEVVSFQIQNVSGGNSATVEAGSDQFDLTILDNDFPLVINEFCPFPSISSEGGVDANGDNNVNGNNDEFIELVNTSGGPLDITGWKIYGGTSPSLRYTFDQLVLKPEEAVVVFGAWHQNSGGQPPSKIGSSKVYFAVISSTPSSSLGMTNSGSTIEIRDAADVVVTSYTYGGSESVNSVSRVLSPEMYGDAYVPHPLLNGRTISPGTRTDGSPFITTTEVQFSQLTGGLYENEQIVYEAEIEIILPDPNNATTFEVELTTQDPDNEVTFYPTSFVFAAGETQPKILSITINDDSQLEGDELFTFAITNVAGGNQASVGTNGMFGFRIYDDDLPIIFNEVHAAPAQGDAGDANNDHTRDAGQDEFIELVNVTDTPIDLSGWSLYGNSTLRHVFQVNTILPSGKAIVVFGGGSPVGFFGGSQYVVASEGSLGLTNTGAFLELRNAQDEITSAFSYGAEGNQNQSITRSPDITGYYVIHLNAVNSNGKLYSPGLRSDGLPFGDITTDVPEVPGPAIYIYPNPAQNFVTIELEDNGYKRAYYIRDAIGNLVSGSAITDSGKVTIDVTDLKPGLYFVQVTEAGSLRVLKQEKLMIIK